ncbi:MAG: creatininase family protein [Roseiflexaceae bacterium]
MAESPLWGRYEALRPHEFEQILRETPIAYLPWGALEWHGAHLPLGSEGYIAEALAERSIQRTGGVLLPTTWWPIAAVPHPYSISIPSETIHELWDAIFTNLARIGFRLVVVITGHYGHGHDLVLMDAAEHAIHHLGLKVLAIPPLALVDERMLDHAAHWETAQMMAIKPRLVALEALNQDQHQTPQSGVIGDDPRLATASQGESALKLANERIVTSVRAVLGSGGNEILRELYIRRRSYYQEYVDAYFHGSWDEAVRAWWDDWQFKSRGEA